MLYQVFALLLLFIHGGQATMVNELISISDLNGNGALECDDNSNVGLRLKFSLAYRCSPPGQGSCLCPSSSGACGGDEEVVFSSSSFLFSKQVLYSHSLTPMYSGKKEITKTIHFDGINSPQTIILTPMSPPFVYLDEIKVMQMINVCTL